MTIPEFRTRLILGLNIHAPTLKLEQGWCVVNNWTLFRHVITRDGNDKSVNIYRKSTWQQCLPQSKRGQPRAHV